MMTRNIKARNAPKNAPGWLRKQLKVCEREKNYKYTLYAPTKYGVQTYNWSLLITISQVLVSMAKSTMRGITTGMRGTTV